MIERPDPSSDATEDTELDSDAIEAELEGIAERRRTDRVAYMRDNKVQSRELELLEQREQLRKAERDGRRDRAEREEERPRDDRGRFVPEELAGLDIEDVDKYRRLLKDGTFTREELGKHYHLTAEELDALSKPAARGPSRASIAAELAEIAALRKTDPRKYWSNENLDREQALLEQQQAIKASQEKSKPDGRVRSDDLDRRQLDAELAEIDRMRREDPKRYWARDTQQLEQELLAARDQANERFAQDKRARAAVDAILEAVPDAEAFEAGFDAMPAEARAAIRRELSLVADSPVRLATAADLERFATTEEGAACVREWGKDAARKLAIVRERMARINSEAVWDFYESLSSADAKVVLQALAG